MDLSSDTPIYSFNFKSLYDTIDSLLIYERRFHCDILDYEKSRSSYYSLISLIIENLSNNVSVGKYQEIEKILKDNTRPFLVWILYGKISSNYPEVLPYLIADPELVPIVLRMVDDVVIDQNILKKVNHNDLSEKYDMKTEIWLEMFEFVLDKINISNSRDKEIGNMFARILLDTAEKSFNGRYTGRFDNNRHKFYKIRYQNALSLFESKRIVGNRLTQKLVNNSIQNISTHVIDKLNNPDPSNAGFLYLNSGLVDFSIKLLSFYDCYISGLEDSIKKEEIGKSLKELVISLKDYMTMFYCTKEMFVVDYYSGLTKTEKVRRGTGEFGYEIIDWGCLFLHFQKYDFLKIIDSDFTSSLSFNKSESEYDEENLEQYEKIKTYLKTLLVAYASINKSRDKYESHSLPVIKTVNELERLIKDYSIRYSRDELSGSKIDVFNERFHLSENNIYYTQLIKLLYESVNYFSEKDQVEFFKEFFFKSVNFERMLKAINSTGSKDVKDVISKRIKEIKIEDFINSAHWITELEHALVEAVNSEQHWVFAKSLVEEVERHHKKRKTVDARFKSFMFEIKLLLAFKGKDWETLNGLEIPKTESTFPNKFSNEDLKTFYISIYKIYNDKNYPEAVEILKSLSKENPQNVKYHLYLYCAQTLEANEKNFSKEILNKANVEWDSFVDNLKNDEEKEKLTTYLEAVESNKLFYFVSIEDTLGFDQSISKLSPRYLYDEDIIPVIYEFYKKREMYEFASNYIKKSECYISEQNKGVTETVHALIENSKLERLPMLKESFKEIITQKPNNVPKITPECINDKKDLEVFVLSELILALQTLLKKKVSAQKIFENHYNDFIQAVLLPRFAIWGWNINDQPRTGKSDGGKDAGSADLVLSSRGNDFALIEALVFGAKKYNQDHILKCEKYIGSLNRYYVLIYHTKKSEKLDENWGKYKSHVLGIKYPSSFLIDKGQGFVDISNEFEDVRNFKIAKTLHGESIEMFHVMINLGD